VQGGSGVALLGGGVAGISGVVVPPLRRNVRVVAATVLVIGRRRQLPWVMLLVIFVVSSVRIPGRVHRVSTGNLL
jgi:hypothetical protein